MLGGLEANRDGKRRWSRVAWAATGLLWAFLFFSGADQVASNTFIDRSSDGSAAPDALFRYVAENPTVVGALLITLAVANILFVLFAAHIAYWLGPTVKLRWLPATVVMVAALGTLPFWFADVSTAVIWMATATGTASAGYRWISPTIDALVPLGLPVLGLYVGLVAYMLGQGGILPAWVRWFTWGIAVLAVAFGGLAIAAPTTGPGGPLGYVSIPALDNDHQPHRDSVSLAAQGSGAELALTVARQRRPTASPPSESLNSRRCMSDFASKRRRPIASS